MIQIHVDELYTGTIQSTDDYRYNKVTMKKKDSSHSQGMIQYINQRTLALFRVSRVALWGGLLAICLATFATLSYAGNLTPPGPPANTMYTLTDIYNLASSAGATTTEGSGALPATPGATSSTFHTLTEIYEAIAGEINKLSSTTIATGTTAFGITGTLEEGGGGVVVTGQDTCWNASGDSISCTDTGQDGEIQAGLAFDYTDNDDGTVTDNNTGLIWQQGNSASTMDWEDALAYCNENTPDLPGSGWRLPNVKELFTLVDFGISSVAKIDLDYFPGTPAGVFWSATTVPLSGNQGGAMRVSFNSGLVINIGKTVTYYVRCVRE